MKKWIFISDEAIEAETKEDAYIKLAKIIDSQMELTGLFRAYDMSDDDE